MTQLSEGENDAEDVEPAQRVYEAGRTCDRCGRKTATTYVGVMPPLGDPDAFLAFANDPRTAVRWACAPCVGVLYGLDQRKVFSDERAGLNVSVAVTLPTGRTWQQKSAMALVCASVARILARLLTDLPTAPDP